MKTFIAVGVATGYVLDDQEVGVIRNSVFRDCAGEGQ
jgi:hypothetical protein